MDFASKWVILKAESWRLVALILYRIGYRTRTGGSFGSRRSSATIRPKLAVVTANNYFQMLADYGRLHSHLTDMFPECVPFDYTGMNKSASSGGEEEEE